jgi:hypothetical protein
MKQLIRISITAIALALAIVAHASEKVSLAPEDLELLRQLACEESDRPKPSSPETQAIDNRDLSPSPMRSAYTEAVQIQIESDPIIEKKVKEFCADY